MLQTLERLCREQEDGAQVAPVPRRIQLLRTSRCLVRRRRCHPRSPTQNGGGDGCHLLPPAQPDGRKAADAVPKEWNQVDHWRGQRRREDPLGDLRRRPANTLLQKCYCPANHQDRMEEDRQLRAGQSRFAHSQR